MQLYLVAEGSRVNSKDTVVSLKKIREPEELWLAFPEEL